MVKTMLEFLLLLTLGAVICVGFLGMVAALIAILADPDEEETFETLP